MVGSGMRRSVAVASLAAGLFAASFALADETESLPASPGSDNGGQGFGTSLEHYEDVTDGKSASGSAQGDEGRTMLASYYGRALEGNPTASGKPFDADAHTAAHKSLPLGTDLRVSHDGESVRVTVNDRGPYVAGRDIDLSLAAAQEIDLTDSGTAPVRVEVLNS